MKVRNKGTYLFFPNYILDIARPAARGVKPGDKVRVVNLHGCPPCNTMGQCHVETLEGEFLGMVSTSSLFKDTAENRALIAERLARVTATATA